VDATVDTGASRSFAIESFTSLVARTGEVRDVVTRIALADRSFLDATKLWRTLVTLAGTTVLLPMLVMPTMLDRVIWDGFPQNGKNARVLWACHP